MSTMHPKEELDGSDEIICPYDFDWTKETTLRDKEFAQIFSAIPKGVHFVWISDSCHAEDLSRDVSVDKNCTYRFFNGVNKSSSQQLNFIPEIITRPLNGVLLSACASEQLSADAYIEKRFNGAFTHYLLKNLTKASPNQTLQQTIHFVHSDLAMNGYDQRPQVEGLLATSSFFL